MFQQLEQMLRSHGASFKVVEHPPAGKSDEVARIRGTLPGQGAKAMLCKSKDDSDVFALAVLPGDRKLDFKKVAQSVGLKRVTLATPLEATHETGCSIGAIPPFSFSSRIRLVVDPVLVQQHNEIAFNAGRLDRSIILNSQDYLRIAQPVMQSICG